VAAVNDPNSENHVEVASLEGTEVRRLSLPAGEKDSAGMDLSWSPDGRLLAYGTPPAGRPSVLSEIWVASVDGSGGHRVVGGNSFNISPSWSRDGRSLLFVSNRGGGMDLWRQALADGAEPVGEPEAVTTGLEGWYATPSPDGRRLAVAKRRAISRLWRLPLSGDGAGWAQAEELTFQQGTLGHVHPASDGDDVFFTLRAVDGHFLWRLPGDGGEPEKVVRQPMSLYWPRWSPDGREIAFQSEQVGNRNIWIVPASGGPARQVTDSPGWSIDAQWSPDGRTLAYFEGPPWDLWLVPAAGGEPRLLVDLPTDAWTPRWSPDGREVAFLAVGAGGLELQVAAELMVVPVDGGDARTVAEAGTGAEPVWSADGEWLYFQSDRSGENRLWRVPAAGGDATPVTPPSDSWYVFSRDKGTVYFATRSEDARWLLYETPLDGASERLLAELDERPGVFGGIGAVDDHALYFTWHQDFSDIWVMDIVEGDD
jgi:Tol biopolymer transport system component